MLDPCGVLPWVPVNEGGCCPQRVVLRGRTLGWGLPCSLGFLMPGMGPLCPKLTSPGAWPRNLPVPEAWGPWAVLSWGVLGNTPSPHLGQALGIQNRPHRRAVSLTNDRSFSSRCPIQYSSPTAHGEVQGGPIIPFLPGHPHPRPPDPGNSPLLPCSQALSGLGFKVFSLQLQVRKPGHRRTLGE